MSNSMLQTRKLTTIAILSAISTVLALPFLQFSILGIPFLKVDLTILPILLGLFMMGMGAGLTILIIRTILWFLLFNDGVNTVVGLPMNFVAIIVFAGLIYLFVRKEFTIGKYILGAIVATLGMTVAMTFLNLVYAIPVYETFAHYPASALSLSAYVLPVVIPFNLLEGVIFAVAFAVLYWALRSSKAVKFINA
ncbi:MULTISPECIES: ECF transporter S component [unclassified Lactococcus]|uniref:ECF transporter S component n=1 Tax=unclassified Lactococcus TaxID=2643510 RepID=UPI0011CC5EA5|nr:MULTISPECIES: ECF transporter S component [unclassified Lactococcus]MQW23342.1 ECF transporter S component [Lactococcus sp. dk101]TXK37956.1 ECF transporter S component [Lactococcus sp. dk310]TXK49610.1 ECF transporter S component [Lactococcus sp. dk322]